MHPGNERRVRFTIPTMLNGGNVPRLHLGDDEALFECPLYENLKTGRLTAEELAGDTDCSLTYASLYGTEDRMISPVLVRTSAHVFHIFEFEALMKAWMTSGKNPMTTREINHGDMLRLER
jgi:hypothetical protein